MVVFLCFEPFCTASVFAAVATRSWRTAAKPRKNPEVQRGRHAVAMDRDRTAKAHGRHARCASDPRRDRAWRGGRAVLPEPREGRLGWARLFLCVIFILLEFIWLCI